MKSPPTAFLDTKIGLNDGEKEYKKLVLDRARHRYVVGTWRFKYLPVLTMKSYGEGGGSIYLLFAFP